MSKIDAIVADLRRFGPLSGEDEYQLRRIATHVVKHRTTAGEVLLREDEVATKVHLLVEGRASVTLHGSEVGFFGPDSILGEMGMLQHSASSATVTVTEPGLVLTVDRLGFESLLDSAAATRAIGVALADRVRRAEERGS
jgi:CRP-like cAMP-binding protein